MGKKRGRARNDGMQGRAEEREARECLRRQRRGGMQERQGGKRAKGDYRETKLEQREGWTDKNTLKGEGDRKIQGRRHADLQRHKEGEKRVRERLCKWGCWSAPAPRGSASPVPAQFRGQRNSPESATEASMVYWRGTFNT